MEVIRQIISVALFGAAFANTRLAVRHLRNLIGYRKRVNESLEALDRGEPPPYAIALAEHLERVAVKGPPATSERLRWDWVGMGTFGIVLSFVLVGIGIWVWP